MLPGRKSSFSIMSLGENERPFPTQALELIYCKMFTWIHTSSENKTPPIGLPKATATPAAEVAVKISRVFAACLLYLLNHLEMTFPVQTAMWTLGPSFPTDKPAAIAKGKPRDLINNVLIPRKPFMMNPAMMTLISDIPDPAA